MANHRQDGRTKEGERKLVVEMGELGGAVINKGVHWRKQKSLKCSDFSLVEL